MKLSEYAKAHNIKYRAAWNRYKADMFEHDALGLFSGLVNSKGMVFDNPEDSYAEALGMSNSLDIGIIREAHE